MWGWERRIEGGKEGGRGKITMAIPVRLQILALKKRLSPQAHIFCPMVEFSWKRRSTSTSKLLACRHHVMPPTICSGEDGGREAIQPTDHVKSGLNLNCGLYVQLGQP